MSLNDDFMEKIENEYNEFVKKIDRMDSPDIIAELCNLAQFQKVYNFIKEHQTLEEKYQKSLLKLDNPIKTICRIHNRHMPSDAYENYMVSILAIEHNILPAVNCTDKVYELLRAINDAIEQETAIDNDVEQQEKLFKILLQLAYKIKDEDAEVLLQFQNPMEIIMQVSQHDKYFLDNIKDAVEYVNSHDIYTMPFDLNHEKITNEAKCRHEAIEQILHIVPNPSFKSTMGWLGYCKDLATASGDVSLDTENPYTELVSTLKRIRGEFGHEMLQQVYDFGSNPDIKYWDICEDSLVVIAEYLRDDGEIGEVNEMAQSGYFLQPYEDLQKQLEQGEPFGMSMN